MDPLGSALQAKRTRTGPAGTRMRDKQTRREFLRGALRLAGLAAVGGAAAVLAFRPFGRSGAARRLDLCRDCPRLGRCRASAGEGPPLCGNYRPGREPGGRG